MLDRSPDAEFHADTLRSSLTADEVILLVGKALESDNNRLACVVSRFGLANRVATKVGPPEDVRWLVAVMNRYGGHS